jgi:hypothetical protein
MPRYFFHIRDSREYPDRDGTVLADAKEAHAQAVATAGAILRDQGEKFWEGTEWSMTVVDETGHVVCDLHFSARCPE